MHLAARLSALTLGGALLLAACDEPPPAQPKPVAQAPKPATTPASAEDQAALTGFQAHALELLNGLGVCTQTLAALGEQFLIKPDEPNLDALKAQWQGCYELYQASTVLQGFTPPHQDQLATARSRLGLPLEMPGFIDSITGYPFSGIVNDASLPLDEANLREQHGLTDDADVSLGFDVLAFLLWGEHWQNPELAARPALDYIPVTHWEDSRTELPVEEAPNNRRRRLLALVVTLLAADAQALAGSWQQGVVPNTHEAIHAWRLRQLEAMVSGLNAQPTNTQLSSHLESWRQAGALPAVPVPTEAEASAEADLSQILSQALTQLLTAPG